MVAEGETAKTSCATSRECLSTESEEAVATPMSGNVAARMVAGLTYAAARAADAMHARACASLIDAVADVDADVVAAVVESIECKLDRQKTKQTGLNRALEHSQHLNLNSNLQSGLGWNASRCVRRRPPRAEAPSANAAYRRLSYPMRAADMQSPARQQWSHVRKPLWLQKVMRVCEQVREKMRFQSHTKMCLRVWEMMRLPVRGGRCRHSYSFDRRR